MAIVEFSIPEGGQEFFTFSLLDAPLKQVYAAYTDAASIPDWWGPAILITVIELHEFRVGGRWRYVQRDPEGNVFAFHGVFHEIVPNERIVSTFEFEGAPGHVILDIVTFADEGGKTRLNEQSIFQSFEDRTGMLQSDMESGSRESMQRLEELARKQD